MMNRLFRDSNDYLYDIEEGKKRIQKFPCLSWWEILLLFTSGRLVHRSVASRLREESLGGIQLLVSRQQFLFREPAPVQLP
jgi:hypothetical protein